MEVEPDAGLDSSLALIVPIPPPLWYHDVQGQVTYLREVRAEIDRLASAYLVGAGLPPYEIREERYQIGPSAEWSYTVLFELYRDIRPILNDVSAITGIASFAVAVAKYLFERAEMRPIFTGLMLVGLCSSHSRRYDQTLEPDPQYFVRENSPYGSAAQPGGHEHYVIWIRMGRRSFGYVLTANAKVIEHFELNRGHLRILPIPDLTGVPRS